MIYFDFDKKKKNFLNKKLPYFLIIEHEIPK